MEGKKGRKNILEFLVLKTLPFWVIDRLLDDSAFPGIGTAIYQLMKPDSENREPLLKGRISTVDLFVKNRLFKYEKRLIWTS